MVRNRQNPSYHWLGLKQRAFRSAIDVGANTGQFARRLRQHFPGIELHCFEPLPGAFSELAAWAASAGNVHLYNMALGSRGGRVEMFAHPDHSPSSSLLRRTDLSVDYYPQTLRQQALMVEMRRLDDALAAADQQPTAPTLLKLDVQGSEGEVLAGAPQLLRSVSAVIVEVCLDLLYEDQSSFPDVLRRLETAGLRYAGNLNQVYGVDGHVVYIDAVFCR